MRCHVISLAKLFFFCICHCEKRSDEAPDSSFRDGALAPDPESRDSGLDASHRPGMTVLLRRVRNGGLKFRSAWRVKRQPAFRSGSGRPLNLAAGDLGRSGGFFAGARDFSP
jgi:hypothetical protein